MDLRNIPEEVVKETLEYKCLQSQFSLLYNESLGVKTQLDEARALLLTAKNAHLRQIEHMEVNFTEQAWFFSVLFIRDTSDPCCVSSLHLDSSPVLSLQPFVRVLLYPSNTNMKIFIIITTSLFGGTVNNVQLFSSIQSDELSLQKKLRTEVIQLEDTLAQVRKEYEMLRIEFEQNLAANEQAGICSALPFSQEVWRIIICHGCGYL